MIHSRGWPAPAKLNLFLHIVGRRADGYHLLQTVFQFLSLGDELAFALRDDGQIQRMGEVPGVVPEADLIVRAARLLRQKANVPLGVDIHVTKRLPIGGGLGGGSSDAATTLVALNQLWGIGYSDDELADLGLQLGADVPVFVRGRAAWAEGVGERLTPIEVVEPWFLVVVPPCQVPTPQVFADPELTRNAPVIKIRRFLPGQGVNVCEPVVRRLYPIVGEALDWLGQFAPARMSGTGASIFAAFDDEVSAHAVLEKLPGGWRGFVARGLNESPLQARLRAAH